MMLGGCFDSWCHSNSLVVYIICAECLSMNESSNADHATWKPRHGDTLHVNGMYAIYISDDANGMLATQQQRFGSVCGVFLINEKSAFDDL